MERPLETGHDILRPRVFISYSRADSAFANELQVALLKARIDVFSDSVLAPGEDWRMLSSEALRSADGVVFIISAESVNSAWVMHELGTVTGLYEENGRPLVLPVLIDRVPIPSPIAHIQAIIEPDRNVNRIAAAIANGLSAFTSRTQAKEERIRKVQARIESNARLFIDDSMKQLEKREKNFKNIAIFWYIIAMVTLSAGLVFAAFRLLHLTTSQATWQGTIDATIASVIVIGLLGALARFAFILGKSFMVESLRNGDRIHAISFGAFYLRAFEENAEWSEVKEAFQNWNIDTGSSFSTQKATDIDPQILTTAIALARAIASDKKLSS